MLNVANTLGLSNTVMRFIERRTAEVAELLLMWCREMEVVGKGRRVFVQ